MRWYPAPEDSGVAAVATALSNQAEGDLDEMKRLLAGVKSCLWKPSRLAKQ